VPMLKPIRIAGDNRGLIAIYVICVIAVTVRKMIFVVTVMVRFVGIIVTMDVRIVSSTVPMMNQTHDASLPQIYAFRSGISDLTLQFQLTA
jgi:hypothetical protein